LDDFDFGGYDIWGGSDTPDFGSSWDFGSGQSYGGGGLDTSWMNSFTAPSSPTSLDTSWLNAYTQPQMAPAMQPSMQPQVPQQTYSLGAQPTAQQQPVGQANPWIGGLLGAIGPLAGLAGTLAAGGRGPSSGPDPTTAQKAFMEQGQALGQQGAMGQLPAQQMQMSLLQALASGQGLPAGYSQLVEQAFQPQMGDLYSQAAKQGRARGFHDAPATSPPGGAILGPGLANMQGQMAAAKLGLMHSLPQLFNQPAATQGGFAQQYLGASQNQPMRQTSEQPMAPQIAGAVGNIMSGAAQGYNASQQQRQQLQQQQTLNSILEAIQGNRPGGMSYT
jgi:hypothetical protein